VVLDKAWVKRGALVLSIGGARLPASIVGDWRSVFTTWEHTSGRYPYSEPVKAGAFTRDDMAAELAEVILGQKEVRRHPEEIVVFECGVLNYWAVAIAFAYEWERPELAPVFLNERWRFQRPAARRLNMQSCWQETTVRSRGRNSAEAGILTRQAEKETLHDNAEHPRRQGRRHRPPARAATTRRAATTPREIGGLSAWARRCGPTFWSRR
jgi:hypothetical protein